MLTARVIPCLDVSEGRVVKGVKFTELKDSGDPVELALRYQSSGADELTMLDISATPKGRSNQAEVVAAIRRELSIPLAVGGGVRRVEDARRLLDAGADKVVVNTAAVADPSLVSKLAEQFGRQCTVLAIDARQGRQGYSVITHGGRTDSELDAVVWAKQASLSGAGEILLTSWDRDGTRQGYDLDLLRAVCGAVSVPVIASGGANEPTHMVEAFGAGASAVLAASIFHEQNYSVADVKVALSKAGVLVRPAGDGR